MTNPIIQTAADTYELTIRGAHMTLSRCDYSFGQWMMVTDNAAARAWGRGRPAAKFFKSLSEVEGAYKSWRGVSQLVAS